MQSAARPAKARRAGASRRKRRSPAEIRCRLLDAAREEFNQRGFAGATTAAIARQADVAEIQLFRYFPSKAELFREAIFAPLTEHFRSFNAQNAPEAVDQASIRERAGRYLKELQAFLDEHRDMLVSLFVAQAHGSPSPVGGRPRQELQGFFDECASLMARRAGPRAGADPGKIVRVAFTALLGCITYREWMFPDAAEERGEIDSIIEQFILAGIAPHSDLGPER